MKVGRLLLFLFLVILMTSVRFPCNHTPVCETFSEHKNKIKKKPRNGLEKDQSEAQMDWGILEAGNRADRK